MKREILFRGKRIDNGEWVYGGISVFKGCVDIFDQNAIDNSCEQVFDYTVGQFSGLTDKNGKKIFEGDIVECDGCGQCTVYFSNNMASFRLMLVYTYEDGTKITYGFEETEPTLEIEIIGTIHDVKEQLVNEAT